VLDLTPEFFGNLLNRVNHDQSAELLALVRANGALWAEQAQLRHVDANGLQIHISNHTHAEELKLGFAQPAQDIADLRSAIKHLMQQGEALLEPESLPVYDVAALEQIIHARRSYPLDKLENKPVPRALIERCIDAARHAPNHGRTHPFRFVVVQNKAAREALLERCLHAIAALEMPASYEKIYREMIFDAPAWVAIGMKPRISKPMPEWEELAAVAMAVQNLHLMAQAQGLGGLWVSGKVVIHQAVADLFGWSEAPNKCLGLFWLGYIKRSLKPRAYPALKEVLEWR
jgi:nitroreductase